MAMFDQHAQRVNAQYNAEHITICTQATPRPVDPDTLTAAEQQFAALPLETIPDPAPLPVGSHLPFHPNPLFVGRESELRHLAQVGLPVATEQKVALSRPVYWTAKLHTDVIADCGFLLVDTKDLRARAG